MANILGYTSEIERISGELKKEIETLSYCYKNLEKNIDISFCKYIRRKSLYYFGKAKEPFSINGLTDDDIINIGKRKTNFKANAFVRNYDLPHVTAFYEIQSQYDSYRSECKADIVKIKAQITNLNRSLNNYKNKSIKNTIIKLEDEKNDAKDIVIVKNNGNGQQLANRINEIIKNCNTFEKSINEVDLNNHHSGGGDNF